MPHKPGGKHVGLNPHSLFHVSTGRLIKTTLLLGLFPLPAMIFQRHPPQGQDLTRLNPPGQMPETIQEKKMTHPFLGLRPGGGRVRDLHVFKKTPLKKGKKSLTLGIQGKALVHNPPPLADEKEGDREFSHSNPKDDIQAQ